MLKGKTPVWRDVLMMWVSAGTTAGEIAWRRWDGIGSSGQVAGWLERVSLETSALESGEKDVNECMFAGKMCLTDCGVENCAVRFVILLMKNVAKSSAVRVDEGVGGGGQRREENALKSMQELGELLILSW